MTVKTGDEINFVDSNIWLYALMGRQDPEKYKIAEPLTQPPNIVVSVQVINEVCANLVKKAFFSETQIQQTIASFYLDCDVVGFDEALFIKASDIRQNYQLSYWDGLIVAAALFSNATMLYTEDMHDGLVIENKLRIVNPFN